MNTVQGTHPLIQREHFSGMEFQLGAFRLLKLSKVSLLHILPGVFNAFLLEDERTTDAGLRVMQIVHDRRAENEPSRRSRTEDYRATGCG